MGLITTANKSQDVWNGAKHFVEILTTVIVGDLTRRRFAALACAVTEPSPPTRSVARYCSGT